MTKYKITLSDKSYTIEIKGHAMFGPYGSDIVCAGISMAVAITSNLIDKLGFGCNIMKLVHEEGKFVIQTDLKNETVVKIMDNLVDHLDEMSKQYPKNIQKS